MKKPLNFSRGFFSFSARIKTNIYLPLESLYMADKYFWANSLRSTATLGIIVLHVASPVNAGFGHIDNADWWAGNFYGSITRWCVPAFVMLSGSFALEKYNGNLKNFFAKTFKRISLPFIFWSIVYLLFYNGSELLGNKKTTHQKLEFVFREIISGTAVHLWFVYMILSMYVLFPLLSKFVKYCSRQEMIYFLILWFLCLIITPLLANYETDFDSSYFSGFIGYLLMGNFLFKEEIKPTIWLIFLLFIASFIFTFIGTYFLSQSKQEMDESLLASLTPNIALLSFSVYLLFKNIQVKLNRGFRKIIAGISEHSYGIFLVHILVLTLFNQINFTYTIITPIISVPLLSITCLVISFAVVYLLKKIPFLKVLIG